MHVTGVETLLAVHFAEWFVGKQDSPCRSRRILEDGCRKCEGLHGVDDLFDPRASFLADVKAAHEGCEFFVSRTWLRVQKAFGVNQWLAGISDLQAAVEYLDHRPSPGNREVLVDQRISDQFTNRYRWEHRYVATERGSEHLVGRGPSSDVVYKTLETSGVALATFLLSLGVHAPGTAITNQSHGLPPKGGELAQPTGEQNGTQVGDVVATGLVPLDELVVGQSLQDGVASIRWRDSEQVEIPWLDDLAAFL